jgi:ubiquinone/menaquinone biosynthesis C-methylase UbiE
MKFKTKDIYTFDYLSAVQYINNSENQPSRNYVKLKIKNSSVLDMGCANGREGLRYQENTYVGIDISLELLLVAKIRMPINNFISGDLNCLPFKNKSFDYSIIRSVLEHNLNLFSVFRIIREAFRVTNLNTFIIWHTPPRNTSRIWYKTNIVTGHLGRKVPQNQFPRWIFMLLLDFKSIKIGPHEVWEVNVKKKLGRITKRSIFCQFRRGRRF